MNHVDYYMNNNQSEATGLRYALIIPMICYAYIAGFGFKGYKDKVSPSTHSSLDNNI